LAAPARNSAKRDNTRPAFRDALQSAVEGDKHGVMTSRESQQIRVGHLLMAKELRERIPAIFGGRRWE